MNFGVNRAILISGMVIVVLTVVHEGFGKGAKQTGLTRILVGASIACLVLAFVDMIPGAQPVTTALALLAMFATLLAYGGDLLGLFGKTIATQPAVGAQAAIKPGIATSPPTGGKL